MGLVALFACAAALAVPQLRLSRSDHAVNLTPVMATDVVPSSWAQDPQALWDLPVKTTVGPASWTLDAGRRMVGRIVLQGSRERDDYVVVVPSSRVDEVQIWYRDPATKDWKGAVAGDRIALSRWPFVASFPSFPVELDEASIELIVTAMNDGPVDAPVMIQPDVAYRAAQTRQAQVSGLVAGLGVMVVIVCLISAAALRPRSNALLAGFAAWALLALVSFSGDLGIWLTPEWPAINDGSKHFTVVVMSGLLVMVTTEALDRRLLSKRERALAWVLPAAALAYALAQALYLPQHWRLAGGYLSASTAILLSLGMCFFSRLRGGANTGLIAMAVLCYVMAVTLQSLPFGLVMGLDLRSAGTAVALFACVLILRSAVFLHERYGRDVLGRAAIEARRDPLTALLSYSGFQDAYDATALRLRAGHEPPAAMLFLLPGLERSTEENGFEVVERALVRFAASLQRVLGDSWTLARLSKRRFAAISMSPVDEEALQAAATQVLAEGARLKEPLSPLTDFDLKIAGTRCRTTPELRMLLGDLEMAAAGMGEKKRIVIF